ncbi:unnamed protein product [Trifolium pratense]|uniref:Uncharacterized protein n=1 Tax=Trifolium pratense TaxID=57577 RepID=A0ACB0KR28_TRIPR|nr:unnamed protein product [Trifolium pratense]
MEGELSCENPEVTNLDLETDDVSDGSNMSSPEHDSNSNEYGSEHDAGSYTAEEDTVVIRDMADIKKISVENFHLTDISKYEFASLDVAYKFYCWFAKMSGFSVRKGHVIRNRERHVLQQTFLCSREGFRHSQGLNPEERQRQQKNITRCGCMAKCRVHIDIRSRRWYVTVFEFEHNHELLNGTMCGFLPAYRKMAQGDIDEIERNRTAGIRPYQVYGSMANASGGFHKVGFVKKDLYNQVGKQRKEVYSDTCRAVREIEADFQSNYGEPVLQTSMRSIEKSAAKQFTKEIFLLFRSILKNAVLLRITGSVELSTGYIFNVSKYCGDGSEWYVTFCEEPIDFKCSCLRMESLGLPCDHILATMLYLDFDQLPECLVLPRWSKYAKDSIRDTYASGSLYWDAQPAARFSAIVQMCKVAAELVFNDLEEYNHIVDILGGEIRRLKIKRNDQSGHQSGELSPVLQTGIEEVDILNPDVVRTKGCGAMPNGTPSNHRSHRSCGVCRVVGHNKRSCPHVHTTPLGGDTQYSASESRHYYDDSYEFVDQSVSEMLY